MSCAYEQAYEWSQPRGPSNHHGIFFSITRQHGQQFVCATMPLQSDKHVCCYLNLLEVTGYVLMMQILADLPTLICLQPLEHSIGSQKCLDCSFSHAGVGFWCHCKGILVSCSLKSAFSESACACIVCISTMGTLTPPVWVLRGLGNHKMYKNQAEVTLSMVQIMLALGCLTHKLTANRNELGLLVEVKNGKRDT